jgi:hypothetical protein
VTFRQRLPGGRGIIGGHLHHVVSVSASVGSAAKTRARPGHR